ncbi:hypothetical protein ACOMHN_032451 [Nucella lapillus]
MRRLICRYIHQTKKQLRQDGVNEDDLLEIKQDISSLRFELREDRKKESLRNTGHMDNLRRDLRHSFLHFTPPSHPSSSQPLPPRGYSAFQDPAHPSSSSCPYPYIPGPGPGGSGSSSPAYHHRHQGLLSRSEVEMLKKELVSELREEVRIMTKQILSACLPRAGNGMVVGGRGGGGGGGGGGGERNHPHPHPHPHSGMVPEPQAVPQLHSELYHTHLFTQL